MKVSNDSKKIKEVLNRGVDTVYPSREKLAAVLKSGRRLRLYNGIDPTGSELTLGHAVVLQKLEQFRALGHQVILLIGDFTAQIGDPTGKTLARKPLTPDQVRANLKKYKTQIQRVLNLEDKTNPVIIRHNSEWWDQLSLREFFKIANLISKQRLEERDMFKERERRGQEISAAELLYPILQGYDSVVLDVDLEVGGTDQTFNMLVGRRFLDRLKQKEKFVMTLCLLTDASGRKIGKTEGNLISLAAGPDELYGKIMALGDEAILPLFESLTDCSMIKIKEMARAMKKGDNPRDFKARLANLIVARYHSKKDAAAAARGFDRLFRQHQTPEGMPEIRVRKGKWLTTELLVAAGLVSSKSEARRLILQGGLKINEKAVEDPNGETTIGKNGAVLQKGKRHFLRLHLEA